MKQFWMLRRYLKQNQVNKDPVFSRSEKMGGSENLVAQRQELQFRIEKFLEYRIMKVKNNVCL